MTLMYLKNMDVLQQVLLFSHDRKVVVNVTEEIKSQRTVSRQCLGSRNILKVDLKYCFWSEVS